MGFLWDLLKSIVAAYQAKRATKAAAQLPQGNAAITAIDADGTTIEAQLAAAKAAH